MGTTRRVLYLIGGFASLVLGGIGVVLPLLPTTPFVILAAACFARSSPRMHAWLLSNRLFGPLIVDWLDHGRIPRRAKTLATIMIVAFGAVAVAVARWWWLRVALIGWFVAILAWLWTRPS